MTNNTEPIFSVEILDAVDYYSARVWYNEKINKDLLIIGASIHRTILELLVGLVFQIAEEHYLDIETILKEQIARRQAGNAIKALGKGSEQET